MLIGFPLPRDYGVCATAAGNSISRETAPPPVCVNTYLVLRGVTQLWVTLQHAGMPGGPAQGAACECVCVSVRECV